MDLDDLSDASDEALNNDSELSGINIELILSSKNGKVGIMESLLDKGAHLFATDSHRWTILHWSAANGHTGSVESILRRIRDPGKVKSFVNRQEKLVGFTALHVCMVMLNVSEIY